MFHSRSFITHVSKLKKHTGGDEASFVRALEEQFTRQLSHLPADLTADMFGHCTTTRTSADEQIQVLADMLDLMHQQYDDDADPLTVEDWQALRDIIDQYALDLQMELVQYVMERVVSHRAL